MNIMIYDIKDRLTEFVSKLEKVRDISIFFAFNRDEALKIVKKAKPEIILTNNKEKENLLKSVVDRPILNVFNLYDNSTGKLFKQIHSKINEASQDIEVC